MVAVSVLMVAHNAGEYLRLAVDSVLGQTWRDLELVLVDNASTDGSVPQLEGTCSDRRLRVLHLDRNDGPYAGAVRGLDLCTGAFIARMDADDESCPQRLAVQVGALHDDRTLDALSCFTVEIDAEGHEAGGQRTLCDPEDIQRRAWQEMPIIHAGIVARRQVFDRYPYRAEFFTGGDYDQILRALATCRVGALPVRLYRRRRHEDSITTRSRTLQAACGCAARLAWARRTRGASEDLERELTFARQCAERLATRADVLSVFAGRALDLGFTPLALVLARAAYWEDPSAARLARVVRALAHAGREHPGRMLRALRTSSRAPLHASVDDVTTAGGFR